MLLEQEINDIQYFWLASRSLKYSIKYDWSFEETNSLSVQEDPHNNVKNNNQIKLTIEPSPKTKELQRAHIVGVQRNKRHWRGTRLLIFKKSILYFLLKV